MIAQTQSLELLDPAPPHGLLPDHGLWPWFAAAAAVIILAIIIWFLIRKLKRRPQSPLSLRKAAFVEAVAALAAITPADTRDAAIQSSLILRKYLALAAGDPALYETHEEFVARHDSLEPLTQETRDAVAIGFSRLAELKYAPEPPAAEPAEVIAQSRALLETLHQGFAS